MKKIILAAAIIGFVPCNALAAEKQAHMLYNFYISGKFIYGYQRIENINVSVNGSRQYNKDRTDRTTGGAIAFGYNFIDKNKLPLRVEFEAAKRNKFKTYGAEIRTDTYLVNAYYDFNNKTPLTPYLGVGLGVAATNLKVTNSSFTKSDTSRDLSWNIGTGINYKISSNLSADIGYRYIDYGDIDYSRNINSSAKLRVKADHMSHEVLMGLRYTF